MINSEGAPANKGLSPGKRLLQGRLQLGLTQEQVAKELYITLTKIKALEADDYGRLTNDTFIRGYIRAYANLLKLDVVEILAAYDELLKERSEQAPPAPTASEEAPVTAAPHNGGLTRSLLLVALLVGLWLIAKWFLDGGGEENIPVVTVSSSSVSASAISTSTPAVKLSAFSSSASSTAASVSSSNKVLSVVSSSKSGVGATVTSSAVLKNVVLADAATASSASANASSTKTVKSRSSASRDQATNVSSVADTNVLTSSAAGVSEKTEKSTKLDKIVFNFRAESWLEVSDSRGDVLATELQGAGSSITLLGKAPFDVKLGNAPAVDIELNGKKVDVIPLLGSNVLTLRVNN